jgi:ubiquinone/menaquinone biosynthesis C-methylase UbiE
MNWEGFAQVDPLWAICADPVRHGRAQTRWTPEEFFATGQLEINADRPQCHFALNDTDDLRSLHDQAFGFIYTSIVLQHIPPHHVARYLGELIRVLAVGGVFVFQLVDAEHVSLPDQLRRRFAYRRWITRLLRRRNTTAFHMAMHRVPEAEVRALLADQPVRIEDVQWTNAGMASYNGNLQFLEQAPAQGYVSKQYCVVKAR